MQVGQVRVVEHDRHNNKGAASHWMEGTAGRRFLILETPHESSTDPLDTSVGNETYRNDTNDTNLYSPSHMHDSKIHFL